MCGLRARMVPAANRTTPGQSPAMVTLRRRSAGRRRNRPSTAARHAQASALSLIHISEPTRLALI
eukprot:3623949-Alexandrium_andersonii.AAC.1